MSDKEQTVVKATARISWRKLAVPLLLIMVLPTILAIVIDRSLGFFPFLTLAAILICFPLGTVLGIRVALQEMDRVIAEVAPPPEPPQLPASEEAAGQEHTPQEQTSPLPANHEASVVS